MNPEVFADINTFSKEQAESEIYFFIKYNELYLSDEEVQTRIKQLQEYIVLKKYIKSKSSDA